MRNCAAAALAAMFLLAGRDMPASEDFDTTAFLRTYCIECHGADEQKGDHRFDTLSLPATDEAGLIEIQDIIDQLNLGDMPPRKAKQPGEDEIIAAIEAFTDEARHARAAIASTGAQTVLRRLNRREYLNSVEDLLARHFRSFDPTTRFPRDNQVHHMDNIGDALVTSGHLLDQYLEAADAAVEKALEPVQQPEVKEWSFAGNFYQGQELSYSHKKVYNYRYLCVYEVPNTVNHEGGYAAISEFEDGVHAAGIYEIRVRAHAMHRDTHYDPNIFGMDFAEPFRLGVVPGRKEFGKLHHPQPIEPKLDETTIADGEPQWYTLRVWLEAGQTPRFIFPNGMRNCRQAFSRIARDYKDEWPEDDPYTGGIVEARRIVLQHGKMPHIRMHEVKVRGPLYESWPPESQRVVLGEEGFRPEKTRAILERFAERAYRRPVTPDEVDRLVAVVDARREAGRGPRQALKDGLKAILCSPSFLYLAEPVGAEKERGGALGPHDLAARLSYFLWATVPDARLRELADSGKIAQPEVLRSEVRRMLKDPRSDEFVAGFLDSWLNLRSLGDMPPDRSAFAVYYARDLQTAMKEETRRFTRYLIEQDRPIGDYLDSHYTFVNKPLAELYQLDAPFDPAEAHRFRKVALEDGRRGGLMGMASVLTVTANGVETSPVTRGVWLLENILGTPPPPPPDDVPPIDPDVRGTTTIRDQLAKHREQATCYDCHQKIDPPGFALEIFDPIGRLRSRYPGGGRKPGPKVDPSGVLASGEAFSGFTSFKKIVASREDLFARMLTERLLTYGTGRKIEAIDRPEVDAIVEAVAAEGNGMRTLVEEVVLSPVFLSR